MKLEHRELKNGLVQITTQDERHYHDANKGIFMPSITWITGMYPKGKEFYQWLASIGWDEAEALKVEAGDKGTRQHQACESLMNGNTVTFDSKFWSRMSGKEEELTAQEYEGVMSFAAWFNKTQPEILAIEEAVFYYPDENFSHGFAGSIDLICKIDGEIWIIDFKTSKSVFLSHKIQLSAYKHIVEGMYPGMHVNIAILQIGYARNKNRYKFTECEDKFHLFKTAYQIWEEDVKYKMPLQKDYPLEIRLESRPVEVEEIELPKKKAKKTKVKAKTNKSKRK